MNEKGFTLLEMIFVAFVASTILISILSLMHRTFLVPQISSSHLTAVYLAQEGLEIVRNMRDTNWLKGSDWKDGLSPGDWEVDYDDNSLSKWKIPGRYLKFDGSFYKYDSGSTTKFKRKIKIAETSDNGLEVSVEVSWQERGISYSISLKEQLYNWY